MSRDFICPDGPSCPDPECRRLRVAHGFPVAPPVVNTRDCAHNAMVPNDDPVFAWRCADCGRIYGQ